MKGIIIPTLSNPAPVGWRSRGWVHGVHRGIDYGFYNRDPEGTKRVVAALGGVVESVVSDGSHNKGWGNRVVIDHGHGIKTTYNHLRTGTIAVSAGQRVNTGDRIGTMGSTGDSTGDHLHFELLVNGSRVDPAPYFSQALPGIPAAASSAALGATQRAATARANRRAEPTTASADLGDDLKPGAVGNFVGFIRGQAVGGNNIWYKGIRGHYFHSGSFAGGGGNLAGLADLGTWGAAAPAPAAAPTRAHVRIGEAWYVYTSEHAAYHNIVGERRGTVPAGTYLITDFGNDGKPVQIDAPGASGIRNAGRYWIGGMHTAAPVVQV